MNIKHFYFFRLFFCGVSLLLLTGCGSSYQPSYDPSGLEEAFSAQPCSLDELKGFAADLCVSEGEDRAASDVSASAYALFDTEGKEILSSKSIYEKVYPASTTKILTCLLAIENSSPDELVTVPQSAAITVSGSSMAGIKPGDTLKMGDLLYALMVPSGNDAAEAIAAHIDGSSERFAVRMNERARQLGAVRSNFVNPHGLPDENHYTCVYDMYLIFNEALKHEEFRRAASAVSYTCKVTDSKGTVREESWKSGNGFLNNSFSLPEGVSYEAGKTGHTKAAGFCLVLSSLDEQNREYISIIFHADAYEELYKGMQQLISKK